MTYQPDLAVPGAVDTIRLFTKLAVKSGVRRLVLLSGRGEKEAMLSEQTVRESGAEWTILRASWFCQNYELTGPRLLTFAEAIGEIAKAAGRDIRYAQVPLEQYKR